MISVSYPAVMRIILRNQTNFNKIFMHYSEDSVMVLDSFLRFCREFDLMPALATNEQCKLVFKLVNFSEASDGDVFTLDQEEFMEAVVRLGIYYGPADDDKPYNFDVDSEVARAFAAALTHMNSASGTPDGLNITFAKPKARK